MNKQAEIVKNSSAVTVDKAGARSARRKWDERYATFEAQTRCEPIPFVRQCLSQIPAKGRALDVAAGAGRHSLALARRGFRVDAVDISWEGLRLARQRAMDAQLGPEQMQFIVADIERPWLPCGQYDVILVTFFLHRPLFALIKHRLLPGGRLIYQTFTDEQAPLSDGHCPANRDYPANRHFLLQPGELKSAFSDFEILFYDESNHRGHLTAELLARKPIGVG